MVPEGEVSVTGTGSCWYAMQRLPPLLDAFVQEIPGVRESRDPEHIHRMRVASRRLRAALPLFRSCFLEKQYRIWIREIAKVTRSLGEARDTDVQIAFLEKLQKKNRTIPGSRKNLSVPMTPSEAPAITYLLKDLKKRRAILQKRVSSSLSVLERSGITREMQLEFQARIAGFRSGRKRPSLQGVPAVAAFRISGRLSTLLSYDTWVQDQEAVAEHHAARIAAKKLRYTMEVYGPLYRNGLKKPLARVKKVQEILGHIHDCDVWIDHVTRILLAERTLLRSPGQAERPDTQTLAGLRIFLRKREAERLLSYRRFVRYWESLSRSGLWTDIYTTLNRGQRKQALPSLPWSDDEMLAALNTIASFRADDSRDRWQVSRLALMLFDSLRQLHGLTPRDRVLLTVAGRLYDTGWYDGRKSHGRRGVLKIFSDENLPLGIQERGIVSTIIASLRRRVDPVSFPWYSLLEPENRKCALRLAALFRIADGLDFLHNGQVLELHCTLISDKVFIDVSGTGDFTAEIERARTRADLFSRVFDSRPVIR
jgi:CHAD domain-containing protein